MATQAPTDAADGYGLWVPLQPVVTAGNIYAFSTRLAFTSAEADSGINLIESRIQRLTGDTLDSCVAGENDD